MLTEVRQLSPPREKERWEIVAGTEWRNFRQTDVSPLLMWFSVPRTRVFHQHTTVKPSVLNHCKLPPDYQMPLLQEETNTYSYARGVSVSCGESCTPFLLELSPKSR
ncbi:hypothetical protein CEXT_520341 [Caerostris extrusa]|uniref:Uncharacterized protein n=1 Tax=Caerostris extrusa TaxID=172846 RepID=A0AAV4PI10_CAEEX|nr:hypothetical protein CEXT_520341 [Caerostris extrusa]